MSAWPFNCEEKDIGIVDVPGKDCGEGRGGAEGYFFVRCCLSMDCGSSIKKHAGFKVNPRVKLHFINKLKTK